MGLELYWIPIRTALLLFPFIALILLLPWLIYNYRKYGFLSVWTSFVVYSFIFYGLCAFFLVILPFPDTRNNSSGHTALSIYQNLRPFTFIKEISKNELIVWSSVETYVNLLQDIDFLIVMFNTLLFLPLGVYLRYFGLKWHNAVGIAFLFSLFFEITQRTALYGYFEYPYRMFDVDDLITNTLGALLGFIIAPLILSIFPSSKDVEVKAERIKNEFQVRPFARLLALFFDLVILSLLDVWALEWIVTLGYLIVFIAIPLVLKGATPGTLLMRFQLKSERKFGIAIRAASLYATRLVYVGLLLIWNMPTILDSDLHYYQVILKNMSLFGIFILTFTLVLHTIRVLSLKHIDQFYFDQFGKVFNVRVKKIEQN